MATRQTQSLARLMRAPAIILLFVWMIVPLAMTLYYSFLNYNLLSPGQTSWAGFFNYQYFYSKSISCRSCVSSTGYFFSIFS